MTKNNLRVWGVWDRVISRLEYLSESQSSCRQIIRLHEQAGRRGLELVRFDLSPLYYDNFNSRPLQTYAPAGVISSSLRREGRNNTHKITNTQIKE